MSFVRASVCPFVCPQKPLHWPYLLIGMTSGFHISLEYTLRQDLSVGTKFKVINQGQGQISRSQFRKKWPLRGISVSQTQLINLYS